jgi:hypothetical protein
MLHVKDPLSLVLHVMDLVSQSLEAVTRLAHAVSVVIPETVSLSFKRHICVAESYLLVVTLSENSPPSFLSSSLGFGAAFEGFGAAFEGFGAEVEVEGLVLVEVEVEGFGSFEALAFFVMSEPETPAKISSNVMAEALAGTAADALVGTATSAELDTVLISTFRIAIMGWSWSQPHPWRGGRAYKGPLLLLKGSSQLFDIFFFSFRKKFLF